MTERLRAEVKLITDLIRRRGSTEDAEAFKSIYAEIADARITKDSLHAALDARDQWKRRAEELEAAVAEATRAIRWALEFSREASRTPQAQAAFEAGMNEVLRHLQSPEYEEKISRLQAERDQAIALLIEVKNPPATVGWLRRVWKFLEAVQ